MVSQRFKWQNLGSFDPRSYICGYCGDRVGPDHGYFAKTGGGTAQEQFYIYICSACRQPTYFDSDDRQWPGVAFGASVASLPTDVEQLYDEARRCMSVSAYTAAAMACRKLLMHVAVEKGAKANQRFQYYVEWLVENHYVPPGGEGWADHIRGTGNNANHEIDLIERHTAEQVMSFVEMLLKFVYEMPARVGITASSPPP